MMKTIIKYLIIISIVFDLVYASAVFDSFKLSLENSDTRVKEILLDRNINRTLARAEAVVLLDTVLVNNTFAKDMSDYFTPYADVDISSDYSRSVTRLAYFRGLKSLETPLTKKNNLFKPLHKVSRQEFVKMIIEGADVLIDDNTNYIIDFTDKNTLSPWAVKYMNTAVHHGLIVGNNNYLKPLDELTIYEALLILHRVELLIQNNANVSSYTEAGFETPSTVDFSERIDKSVGDLDESEYYISNIEPLEIHSIDVVEASTNLKVSLCGSSNVLLLEANTTQSTSVEVSLSYQWKSNSGYFKQSTGQNTFKKVCFYPANNNQAFDYLITLTANDNIGYSDTYSTNLPTTRFTYSTSSTNTDMDASSAIDYTKFSSTMTAGRPFMLDMSASKIVRSGLNLGIENITVYLIKENGERLNVYAGDSINGLVSFDAPVMPNLYGQNISLEININTQNFTRSITTPPMQYVPVYEIFGTVNNNANSNEVARNLLINGEFVELSEENTYSFELPIGSSLSNITIDLVDKTDTNYFEPINVDLSMLAPSAMIDFFGFYLGENETDTSLDPTQPSTTLLPQYIQEDQTFKVSWQSQNSNNITIQYSFDQSIWFNFVSINMTSHTGENSHTATISGSLDKAVVYFKVTSSNGTDSVISSPYSLVYSSQTEEIPLVLEDDFYVTWKGLTKSGSQFTAEVTQRYSGNRERSEKDVFVGIYLSSDTTCSTADTRLGSAASSLSASDTFDTENITISLPSRTNTGTWYLCAIADYKNEHDETSESNNASYIMLRDGVVVDALDQTLLVSGAYDDSKDTFSISWTSQNFTEKKRIYYSYNNSSWEFIESNFEDEGIIVTHIPDSLNHTLVYLKVEVATQYGLARSNIYVLSYTPTVILNAPAAQVLSDKVIKITWDPASCITSHYAITRTGGGETDKFVYLDTKDSFIDYFVQPNTAYSYSLSCTNGANDYYRNGFSYTTPYSESVTTKTESSMDEKMDENWLLHTLPTELEGRYYYRLISFKNKLWIIGGQKDGIWKNDIWSSIDGVSWEKEVLSAAFSPRGRYLYEELNGRLYIVGGKTENGWSREVWSSSNGISWREEGDGLPLDRLTASKLIAFNNKLFIIGGLNPSNYHRGLSTIYSSYDGQTWRLETSSAYFGNQGIKDAEVFESNGKLILIGGYDGEEINHNIPGQTQYYFNKSIWSSSDGIHWSIAKETSPIMKISRMESRVIKMGKYFYHIGGRQEEIPREWYEAQSWHTTISSTRDIRVGDIWRSINGIDWEAVEYDIGLDQLRDSITTVFNNRIYIGDGHGIWSNNYKNNKVFIQNIDNSIVNGNEILLGYKPVKSGVYESYEIWIGSVTNNLSFNSITTSRETFIDGLEYATTYYVEMYLLDSNGNRVGNIPSRLTFSTGFDTRIISQKPTVLVDVLTKDTVILNWENVPNADRYIILKSRDGNAYQVIDSVVSTQYIDSHGFILNSNYQYMIKAINANGFKISDATDSIVPNVYIPHIDDVTPKVTIQNEYQNYTIVGKYLPKTIIGNIEGSSSHCSYVSGEGNEMTIRCKAEVLGNKRFYLQEVSGGQVIDGSEDIYINVNSELDTDQDGIPDSVDDDDDNDGITDADEIKYGLDPKDARDAVADTDGDGISNIDEIKAGTDPRVADIVLSIVTPDDIFVRLNTQIPDIILEGNASNGAVVNYDVSSSNTDVVVAEVNDNILSLALIENAVGISDIEIIIKVGNVTQNTIFKITVSQSQIEIEDGNSGIFNPIENESYDEYTDSSHIVASIDENGKVKYHVIKNGKDSYVRVTVAGGNVQINHEGRGIITLPLGKKVKITINQNGSISVYVEGALLPKSLLPLGTKVEAGDKKVKSIVPMGDKIEF